MELSIGLAVLVGAIFLLGYIAITLEHILKINKSGVALLVGALLWMIAAITTSNNDAVSSSLGHETQEIFSIVVFLLAAMTLVETLIHYGLFEWIRQKLSQRQVGAMQLFWILGGLTFVLSAILDNLTTTLLMLQVGRKIYRHKPNYIVFVIAVVIAANAGGAPSPLGDVTTIILWLAERFSAVEVVTLGILPALVAWVVPHFLLSRRIKKDEEIQEEHEEEQPVEPNWGVIIPCILSFTLPIAASMVGLPPFLGLLAGLGVIWLITDVLHKDKEEHHDGKVLSLLQKTDVSTLKFFIGILLAVGALGHIGVLGFISHILLGDGDVAQLVSASVGLGAISAILDNVPLVAASLDLYPANTPTIIWVLLAITAGTGGSMLLIGSAAGVAAMGQVKELNFVNYLKIGTVPAILGFIGAVAAWGGVYWLT